MRVAHKENLIMRISKRQAAWLVLLMMLLLPSLAVAGDRIFADGFDPCCQVGGTVSGLTGSGLVLHLAAGSSSENHAIHHNGLYNFATSVPPGTAWTVSVQAQPGGQFCQLANAGGSMGSANVDTVDVSCGSNALIWDQGNWDDGTWQ